jgi:hypothetical protein
VGGNTLPGDDSGIFFDYTQFVNSIYSVAAQVGGEFFLADGASLVLIDLASSVPDFRQQPQSR